MYTTIEKGVDALHAQIVDLTTVVRTLIVSANEEQPAAPQGGMTVDEAQAEVVAHLTLSLRALEDAAMRARVAQHVLVGDSKLFPAASAAKDASATDPSSTDSGSGSDSGDASASSTGDQQQQASA